jgi:hypothetical protein
MRLDTRPLTADMEGTLKQLSSCERPHIIGVRHHSPAMAAAVPAMLDAYKPTRILLEMPPEFAEWLEWLGHPETHAPVALAAVNRQSGMSFYPFADFSPELAAVRWAVQHNVPVEPFDLPIALRQGGRDDAPEVEDDATQDAVLDQDATELLEALYRRYQVSDGEGLWDRMVEVLAQGSSAESARRAGLWAGLALRLSAAARGELQGYDLARETYMRQRIAACGQDERIVALVGSFHAAALLPEPMLWVEQTLGKASKEEQTTSLIPYAYELFDSRSGYPAGIRDPMWQQRVWEASCADVDIEEVLAECVVLICRELRDRGHVAGVPDAKEAVRLASDLARLRGLAAPGRQELLEGLQTALAQGEVMGRGRALAKAMEEVLVGWRRGYLAPGTPRSGLGPALEEQLRKLNLPVGHMREAQESRLDPSRSALDRARHVTLQRMSACGIPYAKLQAGEAIGMGETLTFIWEINWTPATSASIELAGLRGVTLEQAAEGIIRVREREVREAEGWGPDALLAQLHEAAQCGLNGLVEEYLAELVGPFVALADLAQCIAAIRFLQQLTHGHIPGLQPTPGEHAALPLAAFELPETVTSAPFLAAALRALPGVAGSELEADARALLELVGLFQTGSMGFGQAEEMPGQGGLWWQLSELEEHGSPLMQGAALAALVVLGQRESEWFGMRLASWLDAAVDQDARRNLSSRLRGALAAAGPMFEADPRCLEQLVERVHLLDDAAFLERLQALRAGFDVLSPAARGRLLGELEPHLPAGTDSGALKRALVLSDDPHMLALFARADQLGQAAVEALHDVFHVKHEVTDQVDDAMPAPRMVEDSTHTLGALDRWRLILGRERERMGKGAGRAARALDELYGRGKGEGSGGDLFGPEGGGGGQEEGFPTAREWGEELSALFGDHVREEVLAQAAVQGLTAAVMELDPELVTPSVALLEQVLSLKGAMPESQLGQLRKLVSRIVEQLVKQLATKVRPALAGLSTPRPTRRHGGPLDLRRTVRMNLRHTRMQESGEPMIIPEELHFKTRARRSMDWEVILVVDVSGSMEASVIYSAMMAAILSGLPAISVRFLTFNTEVIDLSERVDDPLALLLEVSVGGGTHIAKALKYARTIMTKPSRTIVALVSDFEEGYAVEGLLAEVRALHQSGAKLLGLASLDDAGGARYSQPIASLVAGAGMPVAALSPLELARWVGEQIRG